MLDSIEPDLCCIFALIKLLTISVADVIVSPFLRVLVATRVAA